MRMTVCFALKHINNIRWRCLHLFGLEIKGIICRYVRPRDTSEAKIFNYLFYEFYDFLGGVLFTQPFILPSHDLVLKLLLFFNYLYI